MSEAVVSSEKRDDAPTKAELAQRIDRLEREKDTEIQTLRRELHQERKKRRELEHDVDFLRESLFILQDMVVGEDRMVSVYEDENPPIVDQIHAIQQGEVDTTDLVGGVNPELPIEEDLAKANDDTRRTELSTNELRAVYVFRNYVSESKSWSGMMTLDSADVRRILEKEGETDLNDNDPRRTMRMLAKKSADVPKRERDPNHEENLFTLTKGDKRLKLEADKDELADFWQGMEERYSS